MLSISLSLPPSLAAIDHAATAPATFPSALAPLTKIPKSNVISFGAISVWKARSPRPHCIARFSSTDLSSGSADDAILLDVKGMMCDGCAASVKRILESQPEVSSASVSFQTGTALICTSPDARVGQRWQLELGKKFANHLTTCGFETHVKDAET